MEVWKDTAYDYIEVSNYGRVRTKDKTRSFRFYDRHNNVFTETLRTVRSHYMKQQANNKGYLFVCFKENGKRKNLLVHRLVADAFLENKEHKAEVNHIDGNPKNNNLCNLEWVTPSENRYHAYHTLHRPFFGRR